MSYYDDIVFLDGVEYPEFLYTVNIKPLQIPYWEITMHTRGKLSLCRNSGKKIGFSEPVVFWRSHEESLSFGPWSNESRGHIYMTLLGARAERSYHHLMRLFPAGYIALGGLPESGEKILTLMRAMVNGLWNDTEVHKSDLVVHYETLISELTRIHYQKQLNVKESDRILALAEKIRANPMADYDFKHIASSELKMSYHTFRALFRKSIGKSPRQFILKCRLLYATELLNSTTLQVKEIADRCGFENPVGFYNFFKKKVGCSPLKYRENLLQFQNKL